MMQESRRRRLVILCVFAVVLWAIIWMALLHMTSPLESVFDDPGSRASLVGMSEEVIQRLLGPPASRSQDNQKWTWFEPKSPLTLRLRADRILIVAFNADRIVIEARVTD